jgi:hypothetical protein
MQGNAFLQKDLFQEYSYKSEADEAFSVSLNSFVFSDSSLDTP